MNHGEMVLDNINRLEKELEEMSAMEEAAQDYAVKMKKENEELQGRLDKHKSRNVMLKKERMVHYKIIDMLRGILTSYIDRGTINGYIKEIQGSK